jgi:hypothetical protein
VKNQGTAVNDKISKIISSIKKSVGVGGIPVGRNILKICIEFQQPQSCNPASFKITVKGNNPIPDSFQGNNDGICDTNGPFFPVAICTYTLTSL